MEIERSGEEAPTYDELKLLTDSALEATGKTANESNREMIWSAVNDAVRVADLEHASSTDVMQCLVDSGSGAAVESAFEDSLSLCLGKIGMAEVR